jgi:hypothetical protein
MFPPNTRIPTSYGKIVWNILKGLGWFIGKLLEIFPTFFLLWISMYGLRKAGHGDLVGPLLLFFFAIVWLPKPEKKQKKAR